MEVAGEYAEVSDNEMHELLLGRAEGARQPRFVSDILKHPESSWVTKISVPDEPELYGPASGLTLPVVSFLTYPSSPGQKQARYEFPYHGGAYGSFENMLGSEEAPGFADPDKRYPLILIARGRSAHGAYDVGHAHDLASHGYIVAVLNLCGGTNQSTPRV